MKEYVYYVSFLEIKCPALIEGILRKVFFTFLRIPLYFRLLKEQYHFSLIK